MSQRLFDEPEPQAAPEPERRLYVYRVEERTIPIPARLMTAEEAEAANKHAEQQLAQGRWMIKEEADAQGERALPKPEPRPARKFNYKIKPGRTDTNE
jgi:hypothetical protein